MFNLANLLSNSSDKIAIIHDREYSYKELNTLADKLSNGLINAGVNKGHRVAIFADSSPIFISAYIAILRIGAVAVFVNKRLPQDLVDYILADSQSVVTLTEENIGYFICEGSPCVCNMEPEDPALILYTSGSTSKPKGVIIPHNHLWTVQQKSKNPLLPKMRIFVGAPFYHMNGLSNIEVALAGNATVVLMSRFEPMQALELIEQHQVNYISSVPTMITLLLQELGQKKLSSVKHIAMASAPVSIKLYQQIKQKLPHVGISIAYGSTEAGPGLFGKHPTLPTPEMSVGYPIPGIEYRIVDGVLQVKSPAMMLKYNNGVSNFTEDRFYITNDLFRVDENGFYFFVGRADDMFVCGGNNVYPRQVELILEEYEGVNQSAVIGIEDEVKGMKPYAFITISKDVIMNDLKEFVSRKLPLYACPREIWLVDNMPLTSVNKIDKQKLKEQAIKLLYNI
jgi:acyl-CoA synthetase (AMP-forming)/AMP-acid ligase II